MLSEEEIKRGKELLDEYYAAVAVGHIDGIKKNAEDLVDYITDIIYNE